LIFSAEEVQALLGEAPGHSVERVMRFSAGWCAGVRIALLGDGHPDKTLLDYLQHELFSTLPAELEEAWRVLAHLPRFNAGLCEHLFGFGDGAQYLRDLQALGAFIQPWDDAADWLQVFAPLAQLIREEPWPAKRSWHRRACQWFSAEGDWQARSSRRCWPKNTKWPSACCSTSASKTCSASRMPVLLLRLHDNTVTS